jgi:hypothetical protein
LIQKAAAHSSQDDGWLNCADVPRLVGGQGMRHGCATTQHRPRASPLRTELWFISYGLLGLTQNGLVPVLMPLAASHGGAAGLTYAAFSLLGVFAPFLGSWCSATIWMRSSVNQDEN